MTREELNAAGDWAFPSGDGENGGGPNHCPGMMLRDYFAAKAIPHALARERALIDRYGDKTMQDHVPGAAALAYRIADAMLRARTIPSQDRGTP